MLCSTVALRDTSLLQLGRQVHDTAAYRAAGALPSQALVRGKLSLPQHRYAGSRKRRNLFQQIGAGYAEVINQQGAVTGLTHLQSIIFHMGM